LPREVPRGTPEFFANVTKNCTDLQQYHDKRGSDFMAMEVMFREGVRECPNVVYFVALRDPFQVFWMFAECLLMVC
jgi:hypothetical protein